MSSWAWLIKNCIISYSPAWVQKKKKKKILGGFCSKYRISSDLNVNLKVLLLPWMTAGRRESPSTNHRRPHSIGKVPPYASSLTLELTTLHRENKKRRIDFLLRRRTDHQDLGGWWPDPDGDGASLVDSFTGRSGGHGARVLLLLQ